MNSRLSAIEWLVSSFATPRTERKTVGLRLVHLEAVNFRTWQIVNQTYLFINCVPSRTKSLGISRSSENWSDIVTGLNWNRSCFAILNNQREKWQLHGGQLPRDATYTELEKRDLKCFWRDANYTCEIAITLFLCTRITLNTPYCITCVDEAAEGNLLRPAIRAFIESISLTVQLTRPPPSPQPSDRSASTRLGDQDLHYERSKWLRRC